MSSCTLKKGVLFTNQRSTLALWMDPDTLPQLPRDDNSNVTLTVTGLLNYYGTFSNYQKSFLVSKDIFVLLIGENTRTTQKTEVVIRNDTYVHKVKEKPSIFVVKLKDETN